MRAFLPHEAIECLHILRHLCFGVCNTRGLEQCNGHWDSYRGTRWSTYHHASHDWCTDGSSHRGHCVVCLLKTFSNRLGDKGTAYYCMHLHMFSFPPLLAFFLGAPDGASPEALGGADLVFVCLEYVEDLPLCFTALDRKSVV